MKRKLYRIAARETITLDALMEQHPGEEILALETLPVSDDTLKAFASGLLGASQARGKAYIQALQVYNDSLVQWKKRHNKIQLEKVQPAHERLDQAS